MRCAGEARGRRHQAKQKPGREATMARQKQMCFASPAVGRCLSFFWCEAASTAWPSPPRLLFRGSGLRCAILVSLPRSLPTTIQAPASLYLSRAEQSRAKRVIPGATHHFPICRSRPSCVYVCRRLAFTESPRSKNRVESAWTVSLFLWIPHVVALDLRWHQAEHAFCVACICTIFLH